MAKEVINRALQSFKDLTDKQANALLEIIKTGKFLTKKEIRKLLNYKKISAGNASYPIIEQLVEKEVLFEKQGKYEPINTGLLIAECKAASDQLQEDIEGIKVNLDWKKSDPVEKSQIIKQESRIINEVYSLKAQKFEVEFYYAGEDDKMEFWNLLRLREKIKLKKGEHNCIVFRGESAKINNSGVIILSKRQSKIKEGQQVFYGHMIFDDSLENIFSRGDKNG